MASLAGRGGLAELELGFALSLGLVGGFKLGEAVGGAAHVGEQNPRVVLRGVALPAHAVQGVGARPALVHDFCFSGPRRAN